ncbi:MAG: Crp/Fnr family transcriptional regulator [Pyrinomonadaceae bacterium]
MPDYQKPKNLLLAKLSKSSFGRLLPKFDKVELSYNHNLFNPGDRIRHIYFPESGIVSLLSAVGSNATVEVGIVGNEGMIGIPVFLGLKTSNLLAVVQGAGTALRMAADDLIKECASSDELPKILRRFTHSLMIQISQSTACNRFHPIDTRLARWLLLTQDLMKSSEFQITQEFLTNMLGVRREAVNKAAKGFQQRGLISYSRGNLSILDRQGIEATACSCYRAIVDQKDVD